MFSYQFIHLSAPSSARFKTSKNTLLLDVCVRVNDNCFKIGTHNFLPTCTCNNNNRIYNSNISVDS